jgi:hypothetical protein
MPPHKKHLPQKEKNYQIIDNIYDFSHYCLRKLGAPVVNIEVHPDQIKDCISDGLQIYLEEHLDSVEDFYWLVKVTGKNVKDGYIQFTPDVLDIIDVTTVGQSSPKEMFENIEFMTMQQYQASVYSPSDSMDMFLYFAVMDTALETVRREFHGVVQFGWRPRENKLYLYKQLKKDNVILVCGAKMIDPETQKTIWNSKFLKDYVTALIGKQWGVNLSKWSGQVQSAGGMQVDGQKLFERYSAEAEKLETNFKESGKALPLFFIG